MESLRKPRGRLFGKYVVFFVTLVGAVLLASGLIELYFAYQEHKTTLLRLQQEKAVAAASKIEQFLKEIERQIDSTTPASWDARAVALEEWQLGYLQLLRQVSAITEVSYLDASGKEQLRVSRLDLDVLGSQVDFSQEAAFLEAKTGKIYFSPVYFREESEPYMTLAKAGSGVKAGVSVAEVSLKFIWEVVSQLKIGRAGYAYAVDSRGQLIAHPNISLVLRKTDLSSLPQVQAARAGPPEPDEGRDEATIARDREGRQVLTAYATIVPLGWSVLVEQPLEEAFAPVYGAMLRTAVLLMVGLALSILASLVLARKMVTPIRRLQEGAARIGAGALDQRIEVRTGDELEALAEQFNSMAGQLQASYANLEQKVEERTRELREVFEALQVRSRELARSVEELQALGEVSQAINSTLDLQTVLTRIVSHAVRLSEADGGSIYEYDDQHGTFLLRAAYQMDEELIEAFRANPIRLGEGAVGRAAAVREPIQVSDITQELAYPERLRDLLSQSGFRALLAVPLLREEHIVGALVVRRKSTGEFPSEVVELLRTFATQSVLAIQNARLFREIDEKGHQLEVASRYKSAFLASMSHELRTPMNAIIGFTRLVMRRSKDVLPPRQYDNLEKILLSADHLLALLNDVLDLSKIEAGKMELSPTEYSARDLVETVSSSLRALAAEKGLELAAGAQADLPMAFGDAQRLRQCLMNLAGNAVKFTRQGRVEIWVERQGETLLYRVSDTGIGIPQDQLESIFAEFRQADSSITQEFGGTGLGLSITKKFVEMHAGRIWVESEVGKGSTFFFAIPMRLEQGKPA
jgi:signal transduction histidine kinase